VIRRLLCTFVGALLAATGLGAAAHAAPPADPVTVTGPVPGPPLIFGHTSFDLATVGYQQSEFFLAGTADAYTSAGALTSDGKWTVAPTTPAPYTTRIVVNRPIDKHDFNGTVVVEWLNVSGGADASPDWIHTHVELIRRGYAWVGVSAQAVGLNALKLPPCGPNPTGPCGDPVRYASMLHPGDSYSYDIYSEAAETVRKQARTVLGGLRPRRVIAAGESQSAGRLVTYIDAVHPLARVYDGFLVHSRGAAGAPLSQTPLPAVSPPNPTFIRDDIDTPVLVFHTENDSGIAARQPDTADFRLWEVAGTAHFDLYGLQQGATDTGGLPTVRNWFVSLQHPTNQPIPNFTCGTPINSGPQTFVLRAAISKLNRWVATGTPPRSAPRLETVSTSPVQYALDADGNVRGGIRTPAVDAAVAKLSGFGQTGTTFCFLFGTTEPFTAEQLEARYGSHGRFVLHWIAATVRSALGGYLLPEDAWLLAIAGVQSDILQ
jgi:hypothetical protein